MDRRLFVAAGSLIALAGCFKPTADIQILAISDWHGQLDPVSETVSGVATTYGGIGLLKVYLDEQRAANPDTIFVTAGDNIGATPPLSSCFEDRPAVAGLNYIGLQFSALGNHEFDRGIDGLQARMDEAAFVYVSSNLTHVRTELGARPVVPFQIVELGKMAPKAKVAFLGLINPDAPALSFPGRFRTMEIQDPVDATTAAAMNARSAGATVVVAMVHLGATGTDDAGAPTGPLIDFAREVTGVDVVVAGNTGMVVNGVFGNALVVGNRSKGRTFAKIQISIVEGEITSTSAEIVDPAGSLTDETITCPATACPDASWTCSAAGRCVQTVETPDPTAETLLQPYRTQLAARYDLRATRAEGVFARDGVAERTGEVPIGDLIAGALLDRYRASDSAQIAFVSGGGIRAPLPSSYVVQDTSLVRTGCSAETPCDVVVGDVYTVLPSGNELVVRRITGHLLWQLLDHSVARMPAADGRFLQIAGFTFQWKESAAAGSRVQSVTLLDAAGNPAGAIANDETEYVLVTTDFTNQGGDGYTMLQEPIPTAGREIVADVVLQYLQRQPSISPSQYPGGRILRIP